MPAGIQKRQGRRLPDDRDTAKFIASVCRKIPEGAQGFDRMFGGVDDESSQHIAQRMQLKIEAGHNPESAGATTQAPKEIGVFLEGSANESAVRQHHAGAAQIVTGETVFAHQPSRTAAEGESAHSGARNQASRGGEALDCGRRVYVAPYGAALNRRHTQIAVNRDMAQL